MFGGGGRLLSGSLSSKSWRELKESEECCEGSGVVGAVEGGEGNSGSSASGKGGSIYLGSLAALRVCERVLRAGPVRGECEISGDFEGFGGECEYGCGGRNRCVLQTGLIRVQENGVAASAFFNAF